MNTTSNWKKVLAGTLFAAAVGAALPIATPRMKTARLMRTAYADAGPRVIEIKAKQFEFLPNEITLKKGEPVVLRLSSLDRKHGFFVRALKIDADIVPGQTTDVAVTPSAAGEYTIICDHFCGAGHDNMKMKMTVVE
jgi:cytochrome c oxidase subunit II